MFIYNYCDVTFSLPGSTVFMHDARSHLRLSLEGRPGLSSQKTFPLQGVSNRVHGPDVGMREVGGPAQVGVDGIGPLPPTGGRHRENGTSRYYCASSQDDWCTSSFGNECFFRMEGLDSHFGPLKPFAHCIVTHFLLSSLSLIPKFEYVWVCK